MVACRVASSGRWCSPSSSANSPGRWCSPANNAQMFLADSPIGSCCEQATGRQGGWGRGNGKCRIKVIAFQNRTQILPNKEIIALSEDTWL